MSADPSLSVIHGGPDPVSGRRIVTALRLRRRRGTGLLTLEQTPDAGAAMLVWYADGRTSLLLHCDQPAAAIGLAALDAARALVLLPDAGLRLLDAAAAGPPALQPLQLDCAGGVSAVFAAADAPAVLLRRDDGGLDIAALGGAAGAVAVTTRLPAPELATGQRISAVLRDADGRWVITADDERRGFQLWRLDPAPDSAQEVWRPLVQDGLRRYAWNAVVHDAVVWGSDVVLAVGTSAAMRGRLFGLRMGGELLLLRRDGTLALLCGELRTTPTGNLYPLADREACRLRSLDDYTCLAVVDGRLVAALVHDNGATTLRSFGDDWQSVPAGMLSQPVVAIVGG